MDMYEWMRSQAPVAMLFLGLAGALPPAGLAQMAPEAVATEAAFFPVGERLEYAINLGRIRLGHATMRVEAEEMVDGVRTFRTSLRIEIGAALLDFEDRLVSWIEPAPFRSRAFLRRDPDADDDRVRYYRFDPEGPRATAEQRTADGRIIAALVPPESIPVDVLDELAALYFLRSISLEQGETRTIDRYFDPSIAPMELTVLETIRMRVPAGRFEATVFRTVMPALPAFQAENDPRIYVSRGEDRLIVQIETDTKVGRLRMYLTDYEILDGAGRPE
ncbi:MAG TPA: DUF3108 domain-containing protein [Gemmatimonadota bacterium]|nr:DUF3108 domain-containing protein [Gemmatimonadota bacterium]